MTKRRRRARLGDVLEVSTPRGLAYIHYTYFTEEPYREVIRILPGFFATRPTEFTELVNHPKAFFAFYPARAAVSQGAVEVVAHHPLSPGQAFPAVYRWAGARSREGRVLAWRICEGTKETLVRDLSDEQRYLPIFSIFLHDSLVSALTDEWRPEHDIGIPPALSESSPKPEVPKPPDDSVPHRVQHFLYFPKAKDGKAVADHLSAQGFTVERRKSAEGKNWLVLVTHTVGPESRDLDSVRESLERLAQAHSGEYDGHESAAPG
ncbi:MAG TPA: ribonuclease E inhibitor RraB [Archangium sp.]|uniref:ribonuclease E inhibitor RraB n=1 Tax=Archangium sp. TaxID=1872627 RepID=UPI002E33092F|nr:ribonuclease E inhibitor RraB [Archangium sp.]HEX5747543.1 ribonuclease E inhibitor RraB [Archangium sp.]